MSVAKRVSEEFGCRLGQEVRVWGGGGEEGEREGAFLISLSLSLGWLHNSFRGCDEP